MEIEIAQQKLLLGLQRIQGIVSSKNIDRIFSFCLIETGNNEITINATNKHQTIIGKYSAVVKKEGKVCVEAKVLHDIVKVLDEQEIILELIDEKLKIQCNKSVFQLPTTNPEQFTTLPNFKDEEIDELLVIKSTLLQRYVDNVNFAVFPHAIKPLDNMFFSYDPDNNLLSFVASNGQIFTEISFHPEPDKLKTNTGFEFLLPKPSIRELLLVLNNCEEQDVLIKKAGNHLLFLFDKLELAIIPTNSSYVNYKNAYPKNNDKEVSIDKDSFIHSIRKVSQVLDQSYMIKLTFSQNSLKLEAVNTVDYGGEAQDIIDIDYNGEDVVIGFNSNFLLETINHFQANTVKLKIKDGRTPIILLDDERPEYFGILNTMTLIDEEDIEDEDFYDEDEDEDNSEAPY